MGEIGNKWASDYVTMVVLTWDGSDCVDFEIGKTLRMSLERKYRKADGPSVLVRPSGISSWVPSKTGSI
jgi:hypothetical protein